ncbi:polysaccharide biosynthesis tyrosine autokinase [Tychonema sp. LEGE 07199]|uniref:GumC family protein n=1 Tax=unclassified Tychonema TaxID=2642144 RepID=UPI00187E16CE|nr:MULTISPECIES: polysaccharide biosynthesis tyrosine autokinase [unclassified Tychonema]MBE9121272.1 polysaccharide biosynthesis tyrosine autokinase [Tychonema sp. LEGE 07199]MBE9131224.1 polysaccharide biosynthesis tyrosine autokinase [Tychonema sp. LEGE 07196]
MDKKLFSSIKNDLNAQYLSVPSANYLAGTPEEDDQVLDMNWVIAVVKRRLMVMTIVAASIATLSGSFIIWNAKKIVSDYEGKFTVLVEPLTTDDRLSKLLVQAQNNSLGITDLNKIKSSAEDGSSVDYQSLTRVLKTPEVLIPLINKLQKRYPNIEYKTLKNRLTIERVTFLRDGKQGGTKLLDIRYRDPNPKRIKYVLEEMAKYYVEYMGKERLRVGKQSIDFIAKQISPLQQKVDNLQQELQVLRVKYNFNQPELRSRSLSDQLDSLANRRLEVQAQLAESRQQYESYKKISLTGDNRWIVDVRPKSYESLMSKVNEIESQLALSSTQFYENSLPIQSLREKQQSLRDLMQKEAESVLLQMKSQLEQLEARERLITNSQNSLQAKITQMPQAQRRYDDIQLKLELAKDTLKLFLEKQKTLQLDAGQIDGSWQIISKPQLVTEDNGDLHVVIPKPTKRHLAIAIVISSLLGIAVGFLVEVLNTVFHTPEEIKSLAKRPLLGVIPIAKAMKIKSRRRQRISSKFTSVNSTTHSAGLRQIIMSNDKDFPLIEAFHYLYANIQLLNAEDPISSLTITSTAKGEGKSTVAVYLAKTASAVGKRVLLVDANMRFPQLHTYLGISNMRGLSDALTSDLSLNEAIQRLPDDENLFVLTAGTIPPDQIKLLSSKKMHYLMEQFLVLFDLVIYDTPPLIGLADGHLVASQTNGTVLIVKIEKTDRDMVSKALDQLNAADIKVFGVVANGVKGR